LNIVRPPGIVKGMRIVVFGANGPTGHQLLDQALAAGHQVVAVTRRPDTMPARDGLTVAGADVADAEAVSAAVAGADAVLSTLGVPFSRRPITVYSTGARSIIAAMREHGVRRLVVVSSGATEPAQHPSGSALFNYVLQPFVVNVLGRTLYDDMRRMEKLVRESGLDWTVMRPSGLLDTPGVTDYLVAEDFADGRFTSRADLAASMLAQLSDDRFVGKAAAVITPSAQPNLLGMIWREARTKKRPPQPARR
jgi:putative NADH-flavin reductase